MSRRRTFAFVLVLFYNTTLGFSTLLYNGARLSAFSNPDFKTSFHIRSNNGSASFREVFTGQNRRPFHVRVYAKVLSGVNVGFCFEGVGSGQVSARKLNAHNYHYGGFIYAYNSNYVRIWVPSQFGKANVNGRIIFVGRGWGGEKYSQRSEEAVVFVEVWNIGPVPTFQTSVVVDKLSNRVFFELEHKLAQIPERVMVRVTPLTSDPKSPNHGFWFNAITSSQNVEKKGYGGVIFAYNEKVIRLWMPNRQSKRTGCVFVEHGWGLEQYAENTSKCLVYIFAWVLKFPVPSYTTDWTHLSSQGGKRSFWEVEHRLNMLPSLVIVQGRSGDKGLIFEGTGAVMSTDSNYKGYGGILYAYNKNSVRIWLPQRVSGTKHGYGILIGDGWGNGQHLEKNHDVSVRVIVYTSNCDPRQETMMDNGVCKGFTYNSYQWKTGPWLKCSSICNKGYKRRHITGCELSTSETVLSCSFGKDLCKWQSNPSSRWHRVKDEQLAADDNFVWNRPQDSYYIVATANTSGNPVLLASPKFSAKKSCSLSFNYKLFGNPPAIFSVEVSEDGGLRQSSGWGMQDNQGGVVWRQGYVKLTRFTRLTQVFFKFILDTKPENDRSLSYGNVSLDEVKLECESVQKKIVDAAVCKKRRVPSAGCLHPATEYTKKGKAYRVQNILNNQNFVIAKGTNGDHIATYEFIVHTGGEYSLWLNAFGTSFDDNGVSFLIDNLDATGWHTIHVQSKAPLWQHYIYATFTLKPGLHTVDLMLLEENFKYSHIALNPVRLKTWIPLGMQSRYIPDSSLSAYPPSSEPAPKKGRLNGEDAWCSSDHNRGYVRMEISLPELALVSRIAVQGGHQIRRKTNSYWVTDFMMKISVDGKRFSWYRLSSGKKMFKLNTDDNGIVEHELRLAVLAKKIRLYPFYWKNWICMRVELYGLYMTNNMCASSGLEDETTEECEGDRNCSTNADCKPIARDSIFKTGLPGEVIGKEACHCHNGYHGDSCEHVGCTPNPCRNGGTCLSHAFNFTCSCSTGYYGPLCQHPCPVGKYGKNCAHKCLCSKHGSCNVVTGHCSCEPGYFGMTCDQPCPRGYFGEDCKQKCDCRNNEDCDHVSGACNCTAGWMGPFCNQQCLSNTWGVHCWNQCNCSRNALYCDPVSGECICKPGSTGKTCNQPCPVGTYGPQCTGVCQCSHHGTCDPTNGSCSCHAPGWTGIRCDQPCPKGFYGEGCKQQCNCPQNAECNPISGDCKCASGLSQTMCDVPCSGYKWGPGCENTCQCLNNATCDSITGACLCPPGWHGVFCGTNCTDGQWGATCTNRCDCKHNGTCDQLSGVCECQPGWSGSKCEQPCQVGFYGPRCQDKCLCIHGNSCEPITGRCHCPPGWLGRTCAEACPTGHYGNGCSNVCSCRNGASCDHVSGTCTCDAGWTGPDCSWTCFSGFGAGCSSTCQCSQDNSKYCDHVTGRCHCKPGYIGARCSEACKSGYYGKHCVEKCRCQNGGECEVTDGTCVCLAGYTGVYCEHRCAAMHYGINCSEKCSSCDHSQVSVCSHVTGKCLCSAGYYGYHCENRCPEGKYGAACDSNCDCRNGAHCNHVNGSCDCTAGYTGITCDQLCPEGTFGDKCGSVCLCNNGGLCDKVSGQCSCLAGYQGTQCIEVCPEHRWGIKCRNKCTCAWNNTVKCRGDTGACQCRAGYRGTTCEKLCDDGTYGQGCQHSCPECSRHVTGTCYKVDGRCQCSPGYDGPLCDNDCLLRKYGEGCKKRCHCQKHEVCYHVHGTCFELIWGQFQVMIKENFSDFQDIQRQKQLKLHVAAVVGEYYEEYLEILSQLSKRQVSPQSFEGSPNTTVTTQSTPFTEAKRPSSTSHDFVARILQFTEGLSSDGQQEVVIITMVIFDNAHLLNGSAVKDVFESIDQDVLSEKIGSTYYSGSLYSGSSAGPSVYVQLITGIAGGLLLLVVLAIVITMCKRRHRHLKTIKSQQKKEKEAATELEMKTRSFRHNGYRLAFDNPYYDVLAAMALDDDIEEDYINPLCDLESLMSHQGSDATVSSATECSIHKGESLQSVSYC